MRRMRCPNSMAMSGPPVVASLLRGFQVGAQCPRRAQVDVLGRVLLVGVVMQHEPDDPWHRAGDGDLACTQQRDLIEAELAGGERRELGVEVVCDREDAAHHRLGGERVSVHELADQEAGALQDRARLIDLDAIGASEREQPHWVVILPKAPPAERPAEARTRWHSQSGWWPPPAFPGAV